MNIVTIRIRDILKNPKAWIRILLDRHLMYNAHHLTTIHHQPPISKDYKYHFVW